eukprot:12411623-Karenia_brevis.AAC.1
MEGHECDCGRPYTTEKEDIWGDSQTSAEHEAHIRAAYWVLQREARICQISLSLRKASWTGQTH